MATISSTAEFNMIIGSAVTRAFEDVIDKAYRELQRHVLSDIYSAYYPTHYIGSGMPLVDSWKREVRFLAGELYFEPSMLPHDPSNWIHGSQYDGGDTRGAILDIIAGGYGAFNNITGKSIPARPMWDKFMADCDAKIDGWIREALIKQGLPVV